MRNNLNLPFVIEKGADGERTYDVYSRLLEDRIIFLGTDVNRESSNAIIAQMLLLDQKDSSRDICFYINSPGGSVNAGLAILDTMNYIHSDIRTVCIGEASSMGAFLLSAGTKGKRMSLPNSYIMIHQPRQTFKDTTLNVTEQEVDFLYSKKIKHRLNTILSNNVGRPYDEVYKDCELDKYMDTEEALAYGIIDEIVYKKPIVK